MSVGRAARAAWLVGGGAVVATVVLGLVLFAVRDRAAAGGPTSAVTGFLQAVRDRDPAGMAAVSCPALRAEIAAHRASYRSPVGARLQGWAIGPTTRHIHQADVAVTVRSTAGRSDRVSVGAVEVGGRWSVCDPGGPPAATG